ncbi:MAG: hypothetical protein R2788_23155 [Saprospiraceae bacterium]
MAKKNFINEGGINSGTGRAVNVNSESFKTTRKMIERYPLPKVLDGK